jgi:hypothetical protein
MTVVRQRRPDDPADVATRRPWGGPAALALLGVLAVALTTVTVFRPPSAPTEPADRHPAPYQARYVSDLPFTAIANGFGPVERDMTNGGEEADDGTPIEVDGVVFEHGLGVHPDSRVRVRRQPECDRFLAAVAVTDTPGATGQVTFTVRGDGRDLYQSPPVGTADVHEIDIEIVDVSRLDLIVGAPDNGGGTVPSAVWADARLLCLG